MVLEVLDLTITSQKEEYKQCLLKFKDQLPFFNIAYLETFNHHSAKIKAFILKEKKGIPKVIMPFYERSIKTILKSKVFDVISNYGYGGPMYDTDIKADTVDTFWDLVDEWYEENHIVSEFIRFNVNENYRSYSGKVLPTIKIINGKIEKPTHIWKGYNRKVRKNVNRAIRENLSFEVHQFPYTQKIVDDFYRIYIDTMKRNDAKAHFYYTKEDLEYFFNTSKTHSAISMVYKDDLAISTEILLLSNKYIYSFLGGTDSAHFNLRPNDFLKHKVIEWGFNEGYSNYVLGGGHGEEDGIFNYKKTFFENDISYFYTGRKIIDKTVYKKLCKEIAIDCDLESDTGFFPLYRKR